MIILLGISKQEDFHRPEKRLENTWEIDNEARISKEAEMTRKVNRNPEAHNSVRHPAKLCNSLVQTQKQF